MDVLIGLAILLFVVFFLGLMSRNSGDGVMDTMSAGFGTTIRLVVVGALILLGIAFLANR